MKLILSKGIEDVSSEKSGDGKTLYRHPFIWMKESTIGCITIHCQSKANVQESGRWYLMCLSFSLEY